MTPPRWPRIVAPVKYTLRNPAARSERILLPILVAIYVATPVVAAARGNGWWLLCLLPAAVVAAVLPATWPRGDPRLQLNQLLRTLEQ